LKSYRRGSESEENEEMPYFKEMSDDELRAAYRDYRNAAYNAGNLACSVAPKSRSGRIVARQWGDALRATELIERLADKRGIRLV
jgi:hypothetical protein